MTQRTIERYIAQVLNSEKLCEEVFTLVTDIFDRVDLYSALQSYTDMNPVVNKPSITFGQLL